MEPHHINVKEQGASAKIGKNKSRKLQRYGGIERSEARADYRLRETLKAQIPFFRGALGSTDYIWRRLEENAMVYRKGRR